MVGAIGGNPHEADNNVETIGRREFFGKKFTGI
jgi:hypothetical protein